MRQSTLRLVGLGALAALFASGDAQAAQKRPAAAASSQAATYAAIDAAADQVLPRVVAWRRDFHEHPELGNREVRTAKIVADELRSLGFEVKTGVAKTGWSDFSAEGSRVRWWRSGPTWTACPWPRKWICRSSRR